MSLFDCQSPVLIIGCRRSGTSLLRTVLSQHSALAVHPNEPQHIRLLADRYGLESVPRDEAVDFIISHHLCPKTVTGEQLHAMLPNDETISLQTLLYAYLAVWQKAEQLSGSIVLKDPYFTLRLPQLAQLFPDARYIHIVRDPRANVSSQRARWQSANVWECSVWWRDTVSLAHDWYLQDTTRCYELQYEELIKQPEETLTNLCNWLGIAFEPGLLSVEHHTQSFADGQSKSKSFYSFDEARLSLWRKRLSAKDIRLVESICRIPMAPFKYEPVAPEVNVLSYSLTKLLEGAVYYTKRFGRIIKHRNLNFDLNHTGSKL